VVLYVHSSERVALVASFLLALPVKWLIARFESRLRRLRART
jgi:hypothetical protein